MHYCTAFNSIDVAFRDLTRESKRTVYGLRYADDLLILASDRKWAERGMQAVKQVLKRLRQNLREPARSVLPVASGLDWLGVVIRSRTNGWGGTPVYGYSVPDLKVASMLTRLTEMTSIPSDRIDGSAFNLARWIVSINEQLRDWRQAYLFADNAPQVFLALDHHVRSRLVPLMAAITGERPATVDRRYRFQLPRGFWTYEVPGARLVVLSSLAPHSANNLIRKPAWVRCAGKRPSQPPPKKKRADRPKRPGSGGK